MMTPVEAVAKGRDESRLEARRRRSVRDQRGLLGAARSRSCEGSASIPRKVNVARRRRRARPCDRRERRAGPDDAALRAGSGGTLKRGIASLCLGGGNGVALGDRAVCKLSEQRGAIQRASSVRFGVRHDGQRHRPGVRAGRVRGAARATPPAGARSRARPSIEKSLAQVRREEQADRRRIATQRSAGVATAPTPSTRSPTSTTSSRPSSRIAQAKRSLFARLDQHHAARRDPLVEHLVDLDHDARRGDQAARPRARHALHEPGAADDAGRADPRPGDVGASRCGRATSCAQALGKTPVEAADYPGFIANRILMPMINEAIFARRWKASARRRRSTR